ncbi:DUF559 domain-containing protein [Candidatus Pacearchaeota archaeon]|nr:DUF559 domain-containing protein [Candidatus Pacearchaeota archaeon]
MQENKKRVSWNKGKNNSFYGKKHTKESLNKMSEAHKGKTPWNKGKKGIYSEEVLLKNRLAHLGKPARNKGKRGLQTSWNKGKHPLEESRRRMSESQKKLWLNPEHRKRMSQSAKISINAGRFRKGHEFPEEIKQKIREYTLKQYESGNFPKQTNTKPERQIKEEIVKRGYKEKIDFIHQYKFMNKFMCDFCFPKQKIIIECDGDFWHANPNEFSNKEKLHPHQIKSISRDKSKTAYITKIDQGSWTLLRFWESDIEKDVSKCVDRIEEVIKKKGDE